MSGFRVVGRAALVGILAGGLFAASAAPAGALANPQEWGATFCSETVAWATGESSGFQSLSQKVSDPSATPAQGRQAMAEFLGTGLGATKAFRNAMQRAGAPDITNGAKIEAAILAGINGTTARLDALHKTAKSLPIKPQKVFEQAVTKLGGKLSTINEPFQKGLSKADALDKDKQLGAMLESLPECAPLVNGTAGGG